MSDKKAKDARYEMRVPNDLKEDFRDCVESQRLSRYQTIRELVKMADRTQDPDARRRIYQRVSEQAQLQVEKARKAGLMPDQQGFQWSSEIFAPITSP